MDILTFIAEISRDAQPGTPGFQAQAPYVLLNVAVPLVAGIVVAVGLRTIERVLHIGVHGGEH